MAGGAIGGLLMQGSIVRAMRDGTAAALSRLDGPVAPALAAAVDTFLAGGLPVALGALIGYLVAVGLQLGWPPVFKGIAFDLGKLFSAGTLLGIISPKAAAGRVVKSAAKAVVVGGAAALATWFEVRELVRAPALEVASLAPRLAAAVTRLALYSMLMLALLAVVDYIRQRRSLAARMRMTPQEAKREHREQEGDPLIKRRRRQRMRDLARRRMARAVQQADVVLVNPTEYAVALRYNSDEDRAPRVLAKGRGEVAERIRTLARQAGVPIVAEPPLTRLIHKLVPEGREIPATLYKAVAEVLAYVYRLRRRAK
jgi:flagellar biosynthesis protein FlhB